MNKNLFIYAYLILLRGMSKDEDERCELLGKIRDIEYKGLHRLGLQQEFDAFMYKYGLNLEYLK